ncbi:endonuclease/exonuclease/phosphatase family protein [Apiospora phragmitis]|uniref:Endonuclease/exonuclease/phosphatase family protein n=1 Tax=Apiospora phragmitis TaxID=2905665 RepID=A0ABR1TNI5_9PEZI
MSKLARHIQNTFRRLLQVAKPHNSTDRSVWNKKTAKENNTQAVGMDTETETAWDSYGSAPQPYYAFNHHSQKWDPQTGNAEQQRQHQEQQDEGDDSQQQHARISNLAVFSWNIDFMLPFAEARMDAALETLRDVTTSQPATTTAVVIFLQECVQSDLATIAAKPWVRDRFFLTDLFGGSGVKNNWRSSSYGTTTLVDRRLPLVEVFRVPYGERTRMRRDALFADVLLMGKDGNGNKGQLEKKVRLCNTHLESLDLMPPFRPAQMQLVVRYLKQNKNNEKVAAGIAAGDFNAIQDFDRRLHADNGLRDAYLEMGGLEDCDEGYTWGQQARTALRVRYGCSRMDKVYYSGGEDALRLRRFERFGAGVELPVSHKEERRQLVEEMGFERPWVTDHLGVMADFEVV